MGDVTGRRLKKGPTDAWSIRERLALASAVMRSGDQNWVSVSRSIKPFGDLGRPSDWFSQINCARQYEELLEKVETPRRKRGERDLADTPGDVIVRKLTTERIEELKTIIVELAEKYKQLKKELELIKSGQMDDRMKETWQRLQAEKVAALEARKLLEEQGRDHVHKTLSSPLKGETSRREHVSETMSTSAHDSDQEQGTVADSTSQNDDQLSQSTSSSHVDNLASLAECTVGEMDAAEVQVKQEFVDAGAGEPADTSLGLQASESAENQAVVTEMKVEVKSETSEESTKIQEVLEMAEVPLPEDEDYNGIGDDAVPEITTTALEQMEESLVLPCIEPAVKEEEAGEVEKDDGMMMMASSERNLDAMNEIISIETTHDIVISTEEVVEETREEEEDDVGREPMEEEIAKEVEEFYGEVTEGKTVEKDSDNEPAAAEEEEDDRSVASAPCEGVLVEKVEESENMEVIPEDECSTGAQVEVAAIEEPKTHESVETEPGATVDANESKSGSCGKTEVDYTETSSAAGGFEGSASKVKGQQASKAPSSSRNRKRETKKRLTYSRAPKTSTIKEEGGKESELSSKAGSSDEDEGKNLDESVKSSGSFLKSKLDLSESVPNSPASVCNSDTEDERTHKVWKKSIMLVWRAIANHKFANIFMHSVTEDIAPGYHNIIFKPMDLNLIRKNIDIGVIRTTREFQRDMMLMFTNAIMYNHSSHDVHKMARVMYQDAMAQIGQFVSTQMMMRSEPKLLRTLRRSDAGISDKEEDSRKRKISEMESANTPPIPKRRK